MNHGQEKISILREKNCSTTFLSENLQEDVAVSLEEKLLSACFWMRQSAVKASTDSTGLKILQPEISNIEVNRHRTHENLSRDVSLLK
jgi:hypothetical protein